MKDICHIHISVTSRWLLDLEILRSLRSHLAAILTCR